MPFIQQVLFSEHSCETQNSENVEPIPIRPSTSLIPRLLFSSHSTLLLPDPQSIIQVIHHYPIALYMLTSDHITVHKKLTTQLDSLKLYQVKDFLSILSFRTTNIFSWSTGKQLRIFPSPWVCHRIPSQGGRYKPRGRCWLSNDRWHGRIMHLYTYWCALDLFKSGSDVPFPPYNGLLTQLPIFMTQFL